MLPQAPADRSQDHRRLVLALVLAERRARRLAAVSIMLSTNAHIAEIISDEAEEASSPVTSTDDDDKEDNDQGQAEESEPVGNQAGRDASVRAEDTDVQAELKKTVERAETAELVLGQAVIEQKKIVGALETAKAEIEKLKREAEGRKRKNTNEGAKEVVKHARKKEKR